MNKECKRQKNKQTKATEKQNKDGMSQKDDDLKTENKKRRRIKNIPTRQKQNGKRREEEGGEAQMFRIQRRVNKEALEQEREKGEKIRLHSK